MGTVEGYRQHLIIAGRTPATVKAYVGCVEQLQRWAGKPIDQVTAAEAAAFVRQPHLRAGSRNAYHRWLSVWCEWSGQDLLAGVDRPHRPGPAPRPVPGALAVALLAGSENDSDTAVLLLALCAGLRRMEIARFRGDSLDLADGTMLVRGKGGRDVRVPAPPALLRHAERMPRRGYWFPSLVHPGRHVHPATVWRRVTVLSARAGYGHVPPHRLRHTYATELVRGGIPLTTVQQLMRHSQVATTAMYVGVRDEDLRAAAMVLPWAA